MGFRCFLNFSKLISRYANGWLSQSWSSQQDSAQSDFAAAGGGRQVPGEHQGQGHLSQDSTYQGGRQG